MKISDKAGKPGSGKQKGPENGNEGTLRRTFLSKLWIALGVIALAEFVAVVFAFLNPRKTRGKNGTPGVIIEAGPVEKFPLESVTAFVRGRFYLARLKDGGFLALSRKCTHLGCALPWVAGKKKFICPCHASRFDIRGVVVSPPAPRALDMYHLVIENNIVKVDTGRLIKRHAFRPEQVTYLRNT